MPVPYLKKLAEESDKTLAELEEYWEEAKAQADKKFETRDAAYWKYVTAIVKHRAGVSKEHPDKS
jgi:hypothetical protein